MKWSFNLIEIFGIKIKLHATFFLLIFLIAVVRGAEAGFAAGMSSLFTVFLVFLCVMLHELAHSLVAKSYGIKVQDIILLPVGGVARMEKMPENPKQEILLAIVGPFLNFFIAGLIFLPMILFGKIHFWKALPKVGESFSSIPVDLFIINLTLGLFNLLPAFPMDGGRILRGILAIKGNYTKATHIAAKVGQVMSFLFALIGFFLNPLLILIAIFIYLGAEAEEQAVAFNYAIKGLKVRQVMASEFQSLLPKDTLAKALEMIYHGYQEDFPVIENSLLIGLLSKGRILQSLHHREKDTLVEAVMERHFLKVSPEDSLSEVHQRFLEKGRTVAPVLEEGRIIGMLTLEHIGKAVILLSARQR
ncbi:MAG: site-2 protease family protein [Candidatus Edwardsbacteria bacterium]